MDLINTPAIPLNTADDGDVGIVGCEVNFKRGVMGGVADVTNIVN